MARLTRVRSVRMTRSDHAGRPVEAEPDKSPYEVHAKRVLWLKNQARDLGGSDGNRRDAEEHRPQHGRDDGARAADVQLRPGPGLLPRGALPALWRKPASAALTGPASPRRRQRPRRRGGAARTSARRP